jgi:AcrB/AcrD/AcrF family
MTSFAFILGVFPLVIAEGAGHEMRRTLGANRQRIVNLLPTACRLLFVGANRQRIAYSRARPILLPGLGDDEASPPSV